VKGILEKTRGTPYLPLPRFLKIGFPLTLLIWGLVLTFWAYGSRSISQTTSPPPTAPQGFLLHDSEDWMAVYFTDQKIGYAHTIRQRTPKGYILHQDLHLNIAMLGVPRQIQASLQAQLNLDFEVQGFQFQLISGYMNFGLRGTKAASGLTIVTNVMGKPQSYSFALKEPLHLSLSLPYGLYRRQMKPGDRSTFSIFDPTLMARQAVTVTAGPTEWLTLEGRSYAGQRFELDFKGIKMQVWIDYKGRVIKEESLMGFRLERTTRERAQTMPEGKRLDLPLLVSIPAVNPPAQTPVKKLTLALEGLEGSIPQIPGRQIVSGKKVAIEQESLLPRDTFTLPYEKKDQEAFLADHPLLTLNDPRLQKKVAEILGGERDAQQALIRLNRWVYQNLIKRPVLSLPQAAVILEQGEGDCNEHATLLLAMLRAARIPSRMALGLVLLKDRFYYHAWVEARLGNKWISLDPTFNQFPADGTHLKLAEGLEDGVDLLLKAIGRLQIEVLSSQ